MPPPPKAHKCDTWAPNHSHRIPQCEQDRDAPYYECAEQEEDYDSRASDDFNSEDEALHHSAQKIKTKTVCFKNHSYKNED